MSKANPGFPELLRKHGYLTARDMEVLFRKQFGGQVPDYVNDLLIEPLFWAQRITRNMSLVVRSIANLGDCKGAWPPHPPRSAVAPVVNRVQSGADRRRLACTLRITGPLLTSGQRDHGEIRGAHQRG